MHSCTDSRILAQIRGFMSQNTVKCTTIHRVANPSVFVLCFVYKLYLSALSRTMKVLKVAILAEKYATDYTWYVDVILNLIRIAGDYVSDEVWFRVIQIVINRDDVQGYAAKTVFEASALLAQTLKMHLLQVFVN